MAKNRLTVVVEAEVAKALKKLDKVDKNIKDVKKTTDTSAKSFGDLKQTFTSVVSKFAMGVGAFLAVKNALSGVTEAYKAQELAEKALDSAAERNPFLDSDASQRIKDFASSLQQVTTYGDETIIQLSSLAVAMGRTEGETKDMIQAALDMAEATGITAESAIRNLNKTYGGMAGELGELIPELKDLTKEQMENGEAVDLVKEKFAGAAASMADTASGALPQLTNATGDYAEILGQTVLEGIEPFARSLTKIVTNAVKAQSAIIELKDVMSMGDLLTGGEIDLSGLSDQELGKKIEAAQQKLVTLSKQSGLATSGNVSATKELLEQLEQEVAERKQATYWLALEKELTGEITPDQVAAAKAEAEFAEAAEYITKLEEARVDPLVKQRDAVQERIDELAKERDILKENGEWEKENQEIINRLWAEKLKLEAEIAEKNKSSNEDTEEEKEAEEEINEYLQKKADLESKISDLRESINNSSGAERQYYEDQLATTKEQYDELTKLNEEASEYEKTVAGIQGAWDKAQEGVEQFSGAIDSLKGVYSAWDNLMQNQFDLYEQKMQQEIETAREAKEAKLEIINEEYDTQLEALQENLDNDILSREEYLERKAEIDAEKAEQEEAAAAEQEALEAELTKRKNEEAKKRFKIEKAVSIANASVSGAEAFVKALTAGPFLGPILAGAIAAMTAGQIALISQQKYVPQLAEGGIATSATLAEIGEGGEPEAIVPLSKAKDFGFGGAASNITININGNVYGIEELNEKIFYAIEQAQKNRNLPHWKYAS